MRTAVFVERDGILNLVRIERNRPVSPLVAADLEVNREALAPLHRLKAAGFLLIATTNQPGVSRGHLSRGELDAMHAVLRRAFALDDIMVCPHEENDHCPCRKPQPGLLREAAFMWHVQLEHSFVISDKWQDAEAARAIGATSLLVSSPWIGRGHHDVVLPDLAAIAGRIIELNQHHHFMYV